MASHIIPLVSDVMSVTSVWMVSRTPVTPHRESTVSKTITGESMECLRGGGLQI